MMHSSERLSSPRQLTQLLTLSETVRFISYTEARRLLCARDQDVLCVDVRRVEPWSPILIESGHCGLRVSDVTVSPILEAAACFL